jgi:hypothetical protein
LNYLPASGAVGALNADLVDPTSSSSGIFGGVVVALKLNVDFSDAHLLGGTASTPFGDVLLCGLIDTPGLNGMSVRQLLDVDNAALGGGSAPYSVDQLAQLTFDVDQGFEAGTASVFAQDHLFTGSCPP